MQVFFSNEKRCLVCISNNSSSIFLAGFNFWSRGSGAFADYSKNFWSNMVKHLISIWTVLKQTCIKFKALSTFLKTLIENCFYKVFYNFCWHSQKFYLSLLQKQPPEVFYEKRCSWKFHKIHRGLFFDKVAELRPGTLLKMTLAQVFSCEFSEISKNTFFTEHLWATASSSLPYFNLLERLQHL